MKSLWCPCIVYALMTCVSIVVAECSSGGPQSWSVWSILNGLFFLLSCILTFWVLLVIKSVIVLRKSKMHFDENGMLKECHSWYFFLHAAYHSLMGTIVKGQSRAILPVRFPRCRASSAH